MEENENQEPEKKKDNSIKLTIVPLTPEEIRKQKNIDGIIGASCLAADALLIPYCLSRANSYYPDVISYHESRAGIAWDKYAALQQKLQDLMQNPAKNQAEISNIEERITTQTVAMNQHQDYSYKNINEYQACLAGTWFIAAVLGAIAAKKLYDFFKKPAKAKKSDANRQTKLEFDKKGIILN